ncbi:MAG TPA: hypothetical protein VM537_02060 [Anaerolineae bacterium]|nr:hypothetical protein [Anaerolineae bacterium]
MSAWLAGGLLLVEEEEGEGGVLVVGVEAEDGVETAGLFLDVWRLVGEPEPGSGQQDCEGG